MKAKAMPDDNVDNPYVAPEWVEEETVEKIQPPMLYMVLHRSLLYWAVPMFLLNLLTCFISFDALLGGEFTLGLVFFFAIAFAFMVAYIGMILHKVWAFGLCAISACLWVILPFIEPVSSADANVGPLFHGLNMLFGLRIIFALTLYAVSIFVLGLTLLFLSLKHHRNTGRSRCPAKH